MVDYYYQYAGTYLDTDYSSSCVVYERCSLTGQIYEVHNGYSDTYIDSGQTCSTCFYCFEISVCVFPSLGNQYYAYNQTSLLGVSVVPSSQCPGQCLNTVYCGWDVMAQFCGGCNFAPDNPNGGTTTESFDGKEGEPRITPIESGLTEEDRYLILLEKGLIKENAKLLVRDPDQKEGQKMIRLIAKGKEDIKDTRCEDSKACFDGKPIDPKGDGDVKTVKTEVSTSTNMETFRVNHELKVYPNPFEEAFTIELGITNDKTLNIEVFDVLGRSVYNMQYKGTKGANTIQVPFGNDMANGIYQLKITDGEGMNLSQKLIRAE